MEISGNFIAQDVSFNDASLNVLDATQINDFRLGGHIIPTSNATYDLGSAEYKIRHLFLSDNSLWLGDKHKIDVSGGKIRFKKRQLNEIPKGLKNIFDGANLDGLKAATGKNSDNYSDYTLEDYRKYSKVLNPNDVELPIDDIIGPDDLDADEGVMNNINEIVPDASFNNVDISEALIGNSASFKSLTVNGVVIDTNGGVGGGGGGATTAGSAEGYVIVPNWNRTQVISYSNPPYEDNGQQWHTGTNKYNYFGNGGLKLATRKVSTSGFYIYLLVTGGVDGSDLLFFRHNTITYPSYTNNSLLNPYWELTKKVSSSIPDLNVTSHSIAVGKNVDHTDSAFIIGFPKWMHSGGVTQSGVIYQYKYDGTTLSNNELYPKKSDGSSDITTTYTHFGQVLSVYGNYLAVAEGRTATNYEGSIYIFKKESNQSYWPSSTGDYGNYKKITGGDGKRLAGHNTNADRGSYLSRGGISIYDVWLAVNGILDNGSGSFSRTYIYKRDSNDDWTLHQTIVTSDFQSSPSLTGHDVRIFGDKLVILTTTGILFYKLENDNWSFIQYITETVNYTRIVGMKQDMVITCSSSNNIYSAEAQGRIYTYSDPSWNTAPLLNILPDYSLSSSGTSRLGGSGFDIDLSTNTIVLNQTQVDNNGITSWNYHGAINIYNVYNQENAFTINEKAINVKSINTFDSININGDTNSIIPLKANGKKVPGKLLLDSTDDISLNSLRYRAKKYIPNDIIDKELVDTLNSLNSNPALLNKAIFKYKDYLLLGHSGYIANHTSDDGILCGAVFIYKKGAINYKLHQTLIGTTGNLFFGSDVVMNDKYIVVGSSGTSEYGSAGEKKGGIHIFTEDSATKMWSLLTLNVDTTTIHYDSVNQGMRPSDAGDWKWDDVYAGTNKRETSLAITKDNIILVGTPGNSKNYVVYFGFSTYTNKWVTGKLNAPTVSTGNSYSFGYNVVTCQKTSTIFVSAPYVSSTTTAGNIFVYEYTSRLSFASEDVLFGSPIKTYNGTTHYFGVSMKIMDNRLIVGNPGFGETGNNGKGVITVFEPKTKYNWIGDYNNYSLSYNNSQSNSFIGSTISANSNFIFSTDYGNKKIIVWKFENGNYNFKVAIDVDSIQHTNIQYAIYGWNSMESDDDNLFYINNNTTNTGGIIMYIYNISTGRSTIDNSGVKILSAIDLSSNSIKFSKTNIEEANITKLSIEKIEGTTVANNIISESMNTKQLVLNSISDDRNFTTDILESKTHINRRAGEKFGVCGIKTNTTSSVGSFLFVANDKHKYTDYDTDNQNGYSQTTLTHGHDWAIFYNVSGVWKYFAYIKPHTTHGSQGTAVQRYGDMGFTLATYGDYVAISAPSVMGDSSNPTHKTGMIYVRQLDIDYFNTEWAKGESFINAMNSRSVDGSNYFKNYIGSSSNATYITPPDGYYSTSTNLNNLFGASIEMNNDYIIANFVYASQNIPPDNDLRDGVVFVYKKDNSDGKFKYHQTLKESTQVSSYGIRISLSGKYLAVSSPYVSQVDSGNTTITYVGEVYIYKVNSIGNWYKVATVSPPTSDVKYYMAFGKDIINLYGDYLFVSANQSPNNNGGNDEGYVYIFKKNVLNDNFTHIQTITITNTDLFSQYQIWYHGGAATAQANVLKYNKSTINFLYKNNILAVPMPTWKTSTSANDSDKGNVILYKNTNDTTWTKIQEKIGKNQYDRMGISTAMVEDSSGVEFLYGYENYMGGGSVNSYTGGIDRVIFPKNIKVDSVNGLNNIEINQKLITSNIEGKDAEFTSIKINGVGVTPGNSIIKDENGNATMGGTLTVKNLDLSGGDVLFNRQFEYKSNIYGREYLYDNTTYFGSMLRSNGEYLFSTQLGARNSVRATGSNVQDFPYKKSYYINILKLNSNNDYEFVTTDPSDGKIQIPEPQPADTQLTTEDFSFVNRVDGGDMQVNGDYLCAASPRFLTNTGSGDKMTGRIFIFKNVNGVWKKDYITSGSYEYVDVPRDIGLTGASITEGVYSGRAFAGFGSAIAMNDDYLIAGYAAFSHDEGTNNNSKVYGRIFIFKRNTNHKYVYHSDISENHYHINNGGSATGYYGVNLSICENYLAVSAGYFRSVQSDGNTQQTGVVFIYKETNDVWNKVATIQPGDTWPNGSWPRPQYFGAVLKITKRYLFSSSIIQDNDGTNTTISDVIYVYKKGETDTWMYMKKLILSKNLQGTSLSYSFFGNQGSITSSLYKPGTNRPGLIYTEKSGRLIVSCPNTWTTNHLGLSDEYTPYSGAIVYGKVVVFKNNFDKWDTAQVLTRNRNKPNNFGMGIYFNENTSKLYVSDKKGEADDNTTRTNTGVISVYDFSPSKISLEGIETELKITGNVNVDGFLNVASDISCADINCTSLTINGSSITGGGGGTSYNSTTDLEIRNLEVHGTLDIKNNKKLTANDADFKDASFNNIKLLGKFTTNVEVSGNIIVRDGSFNDVSFNNIEVSGNIISRNIIAKDGSFNDVSFNNIDVSSNIKLGGKIINTLEVSGNIIAKDASFNDVSFNNIEVSGNIIARDGSFNDVSFNNIEVSGNIIAKDGSFNDVSFNNIEISGNIIANILDVSGTTTLNSTTTINSNLIAEDSSFNNIELKNDMKILEKPYSGEAIYYAQEDVELRTEMEVPTNNEIYTQYVNQTENYVILIVGPKVGYTYDYNSSYGKGKGRIKIYKINESGTDEPVTTLIHDLNIFSVNSDLNDKNYAEVIYAGYHENNIILAVDGSKFYHFVYNGTSWVSASNPTFELRLTVATNGYPAGLQSFSKGMTIDGYNHYFTSGYKLQRFWSASNLSGVSTIEFKNNYLFVGAPGSPYGTSPNLITQAGGVGIFNLTGGAFVLKDFIGTIPHLDLGNISNSYFGEFVKYIDNLLYVIVREAYTGSANGGPGSGNYVSINIYSENSDGTWTGKNKLFLHNLFNTSLSHISYYGSNTRPTGDVAEYELLEGHEIKGIALSKNHISVIMSPNTETVNTAGIYILNKQNTGLYDWSGNFVIKVSNINNITKSRWETGYLWRLNQDIGGVDSVNQFAINMTGDYLFIGNAYDKTAKSDEVLNAQTTIQSGTYYAYNNIGGSITIFKYTNTTWRLDEYVHSLNFLQNHSNFMGNFIGLDKNTHLKPNMVSAIKTYQGGLVDLQVTPNKINNENLLVMNTVRIDNLNVKRSTKGVALDISGDNTGLGNNGVLVDLKTTGSDAVSSSMIRFSNANTTTDGGLRPFLIGAYDTGFHIMEESDSWPNTRVMVRNNGNVGIGLTMPSSKLEVNGDISGTNIIATEGIQLPVKDSAGAPSTTPTPSIGKMVFNSVDNKLYIYNGAWKSYSPDP